MSPSINDSKCVLVTGATSGIGRALAISIAQLPSKPQVVGTGRRQERLDELKKVEGIETIKMDMDSDFQTIQKYADDLIKAYPEMDTIILNAGIQSQFHFTETVDLNSLKTELNVNYLAVVAVITAFIPHFQKLASQGRSCFIVPVTSALAVVPMAHIPNYSATKAALHSMIISLQIQFKDSNIHVIELMPPMVESELHDKQGLTPMLSKMWLPLDKFTPEVMNGLKEGASHITAGQSKAEYEKFGKLRVEEAMTRPYIKF